MFDPKTKKYPYTEYTDGHYIVVKSDNGAVFDKNYDYLPSNFSFRFLRFFFNLFIRTIVALVVKIRMGLRIHGRKNLKTHKKLIKEGIISVCNHIHYWDYLGIYYGIRYHKPKYLVWANNVRGSLGGAIKLLGGIPIPDNNLGGQIAFTKTVRKVLNEGGWLHIYSEGSMWEYYKPIRPFKLGAATYACKYDKPILPMAYTYRKPGWIRRVIFKQIALLDLHIGEPIFRNNELSGEEQIRDLTRRSHEAVCKLANVKNNLYPPIFEKNRRVDYY